MSESKWALDLLRCPITLEPLKQVSDDLLRDLIDQDTRGTLVNQLGAANELRFDNGVVNASQTYFHASRGGILTLMPSEAIPID